MNEIASLMEINNLDIGCNVLYNLCENKIFIIFQKI